jgi:N utilization substance protein B
VSRYKARQQALQILFSREFHDENDIQYTEKEILTDDVSDDDSVGEDLPEGELLAVPATDEEEYCTYLVETTRQHLAELDEIISSFSKKWDLSQMDRTDKNIMRMAICELKYPKEQLDESIILNEAIRLAKRYGGPASSKFVNGILGSYVRSKSE